jgi:hypothetical protein
MANLDVQERLRLYCELKKCAIILPPLGYGTDGGVWQTDRRTAVKVFERLWNYETERDCYRILKDKEINEIHGFAVPRLIDYHDGLMTVEIDIVEPPYILDFGKAYLNGVQPRFSREVLADSYAAQKEIWGEYWPIVCKILGRLRSLGINHIDPSPSNIRPANWNPPLD